MSRSIITAKFAWVLGLLIAAPAFDVTPAVANDGIKEIIERGVLRAGVRTTKKPFGYRDTSGNIVGIDPDLLKDIADRLGVKLEKIPVTGSNRMPFLQQGKIDIFSANMNDSLKRRKIVGALLPNSYAVGFNIMALKKDGFKKWEDLRGHSACTIQGSWYIKVLDQDYGIKAMTFKGGAEAFTAFEQGRCRVRIGNDMEIWFRIQDNPERYKDYEMPLDSFGYSPYAVAVPLDQKDKALGRFVAGVLTEWHQTGRFLEQWKKWGFPPSPWLEDMHEKFKDPLAPKM